MNQPHMNDQLEKQAEFSQRVLEHYELKGEKPLALVKTYGCQQNVADGEKIKGMLSEMGFGFTDSENEADLILFNTCAVREHAEDRVFGNVGALKTIKKARPSTIIALCGCMMQQSHIAEKIRKSYPIVRLVFGTHVIHRLPELLYRTLTGKKRVFELPSQDGQIVEGVPVRRDGELKAWLPIMYGCNNFCSYCVVPYVRGRERSRLPEVVVNEAQELVNSGYKEITLLGQNVNSYGKNLDCEKSSFPELLQSLDEIDGEFWIRFLTSHPKDATKQMIDVMAKSKKICNHLHLPFQSGSNRILKEMNRNYTREDYLDLVAYAKMKIPNISLTSDIIVGFPGETYEDFQQTLDLVRQVEFSALFTFIFSPRNGTPAQNMPDPITHKEKSKWYKELLTLQEEIASRKSRELKDEIVTVLVECATSNEGELTGKTQGNQSVRFMGDESLINKFVKIRITGSVSWVLIGEVV